MKTTNFFIDFIVVGVIGVLAIFLPFAMIYNNLVTDVFIHADKIIKLTPLLTVATYAYGVLFNQISDRADDLIAKWLPISYLRGVQSARQKLKNSTGHSDHDCIQYIVLKSPAAYEYLSFRRSVLRIVRAMLMMSLLVPLFHLTSAIICSLFFKKLPWNGVNFLIVAFLLLTSVFLMYTLQKLGIGYFSAVESFYTFLRRESHQTLTSKP